MRHVALTIRADDLDEVLDRLLPLVPQGVHELAGRRRAARARRLRRRAAAAELEAAAGAALLGAARGRGRPTTRRERRLAGLRAPPADRRPHRRAPGGRAAGGRRAARRRHRRRRAARSAPGTHPTTVMCLELLLGLEPGGAFADLGCGTGVLAIAAAQAAAGGPCSRSTTRQLARRGGAAPTRGATASSVEVRPRRPARAPAAARADARRERAARRARAPSPRASRRRPRSVIVSGIVDDDARGRRRGLRPGRARLAGQAGAAQLGGGAAGAAMPELARRRRRGRRGRGPRADREPAAGGGIALSGHKLVEEGARALLLILPGVLRIDVRPLEDGLQVVPRAARRRRARLGDRPAAP